MRKNAIQDIFIKVKIANIKRNFSIKTSSTLKLNLRLYAKKRVPKDITISKNIKNSVLFSGVGFNQILSFFDAMIEKEVINKNSARGN